MGFLIVCSEGSCNYRREKASQQKRCGIILSTSPHPLLDLLLLYTGTSTLMPKMHLRCTRTACLLVLVVNKTSRSDWEGLQKHETQIHLFCLQKMDIVLRSGLSCSFHIYEAPPLSFAAHGAARIALQVRMLYVTLIKLIHLAPQPALVSTPAQALNIQSCRGLAHCEVALSLGKLHAQTFIAPQDMGEVGISFLIYSLDLLHSFES